MELRRRIEATLAKLDKLPRPELTPAQLRALRAVEVLEMIGTPEAKKILTGLSSGVAEARLTKEAAAALTRLNLKTP